MNLEEFAVKLTRQFMERRDGVLQRLANLRVVPRATDTEGRMVAPAASAEEIAMATVELTALLRCYTEAMAVIKVEFDALMGVAPGSAPEEGEGPY